jgi:hypothetical protein
MGLLWVKRFWGRHKACHDFAAFTATHPDPDPRGTPVPRFHGSLVPRSRPSGRLCFSADRVVRSFLVCAFASIALLVAAQARASSPIPVTPAPAAGRWHDASLDEYRKHLLALTTLVGDCAKARDLKTCDPTLVGPDDRVPLGDSAHAERRLVRYGWLRVLLSKAEDKDADEPEAKQAPPEESARPLQPTTTELLKNAEARLGQEISRIGAQTAAAPAHDHARDEMKQVLAGRDFRNLEEVSARDTVLEKVGNWLNKVFESAAKFTPRSAWVGRAIVWGFVLAVCVGLVWRLMQLERRWRIRLSPEKDGPAAGAASAREWQLWLEDARKAAAVGQWREAIHFVYWAAISRLESRRLWPADKARTPREYLALVSAEDPRKAGLATLTGSFERIWYGGRAAAESDYKKAEQLATRLISASAASAVGGGAAQ